MNQRKTTKSNLKSLDFSKEIKKYKAFSEKKELNFGRCSHRDVHFDKGYLVCPCGSSWSGERLNELFDFFTKKK